MLKVCNIHVSCLAVSQCVCRTKRKEGVDFNERFFFQTSTGSQQNKFNDTVDGLLVRLVNANCPAVRVERVPIGR